MFEALRRHVLDGARQSFADGACLYSLDMNAPVRIDFFRARVVDGLGDVIHERMFAVELGDDGTVELRDQSILGNMTPAPTPASLPAVAHAPEPRAWLNEHALSGFLNEVRNERAAEVERISQHVELSLTELLNREDQLIGRLAEDAQRGVEGAGGNLKQAEDRHAALMARPERRRQELDRQRSLTLQGVERLASVLVLPHPERDRTRSPKSTA
jgi:hypothetical protein